MPSELVFDWDVTPDMQLIPRLLGLQGKAILALRALFETFAAKILAYARQHAPWVDQSGDARRNLDAFVDVQGLEITIYLVTRMFYGVYLELGTWRMAPRPIIVPALEAHYAALVAAIKALLAGLR